MTKNKHFDLIIFDLDGTLVNSQYDLADAVNYGLKAMGRPLITYDQLPAMVGGGIGRLLELSLGNYRPEEMASLRQLFDEYYSENFANKTTCYPGVPELLELLKHRKKAVYSNKIHPFTVAIIQRLGLSHHFDVIQGANPKLYKRKPSPEGVIRILDMLDVRPENAIMVGDSTHDIHAGKQARIATCAVTYGYRSREQLEAAAPDFVVDDVSEILEKV